MLIRLARHRAIVLQLQEDREALAAANKQLNQEVLALHQFIESEGWHQRHCAARSSFQPCDCRLSRAGRLS